MTNFIKMIGIASLVDRISLNPDKTSEGYYAVFFDEIRRILND